MIALQDISFSFGDHPVLQNITVTAGDGDCLAIMGPNGSGKTTLLKLMAGILTPSSGNIVLAGRPLAAWTDRDRARRMAYVPQETTAAFPFRVMEFVLMGRLPHHAGFGFSSSEDHDIAEQALRDCDAWQFQNRRITELSGGEKTRVVIARALAQNPAFLLLDEPIAFLDVRHQLDILKSLATWQSRTGGTVIMVLHDMNLAARFCSHTLLLKNGRQHSAGPTGNILNRDAICDVFNTDVMAVSVSHNKHPYFIPV